MTRLHRLATALPLAFLAACDTNPTAPAARQLAPRERPNADVVVNEQHTPFARTFTNPCNGDIIALQGTMHTVISSTVDQNGGVHLTVTIKDVGLTGIGTSGKKYVGSIITTSDENTSGPPPLETTQFEYWKVIGPGPTDNYYHYMEIHLTTNANGTQTADVANSRTSCQG